MDCAPLWRRLRMLSILPGLGVWSCGAECKWGMGFCLLFHTETRLIYVAEQTPACSQPALQCHSAWAGIKSHFCPWTVKHNACNTDLQSGQKKCWSWWKCCLRMFYKVKLYRRSRYYCKIYPGVRFWARFHGLSLGFQLLALGGDAKCWNLLRALPCPTTLLHLVLSTGRMHEGSCLKYLEQLWGWNLRTKWLLWIWLEAIMQLFFSFGLRAKLISRVNKQMVPLSPFQQKL